MFMNAKKSENIESKKNVFRRIVEFFGSIKREFSQISWTSKKDLRNYTKIVILSTFSVGLLIYVVDLGIQKSLSVVHIAVQRIFG